MRRQTKWKTLLRQREMQHRNDPLFELGKLLKKVDELGEGISQILSNIVKGA